MKTFPLLIAGLLLCSSCASTDAFTDREVKAGHFKLSEPLMLVAAQQTRVYFNASNFDSRSQACWTSLRNAARELSNSASSSTTILFFDGAAFTPGTDGAYALDKQPRQQIIAEAQVNKVTQQFEFIADPFGYGKYLEPR